MLALREASWHGRSEGFDIDKSVYDSNNITAGGSNNNIDALKESLQLRQRKKNAQRGELPPLISDVSNNVVSIIIVPANLLIAHAVNYS